MMALMIFVISEFSPHSSPSGFARTFIFLITAKKKPIGFEKSYGGLSFERGVAIEKIEQDGGGYLIGGSIESFTNDTQNISVDSSMNTLSWINQRAYVYTSPGISEKLHGIKQTNNGDTIIFPEYIAQGFGYVDHIMMKIDFKMVG